MVEVAIVEFHGSYRIRHKSGGKTAALQTRCV